jgi:hypothetical protein
MNTPPSKTLNLRPSTGDTLTVCRRFIVDGVIFDEGEKLEMIRENQTDRHREIIFRVCATGKFKTWTVKTGQYDCFDLVFSKEAGIGAKEPIPRDYACSALDTAGAG